MTRYKLAIKYLIFILMATVLFFAQRVFAQDVRFSASAPRSVGVGEQFRVTYTLNDQGSGFRGPGFKGFTVLAGPSQSSSSSIQMNMNGGMTQTVNFTYTYFLKADKEGTYTIEPATVTINGKVAKSNSLSVQVVKGQGGAQSGGNYQQGGNSRGNAGNSQPSGNIGANDLFVKVSLNKTEAYQGEPILATFKIYTRVNLVNYENKLPTFNGFWSSEIKIADPIQYKRETVNGLVYNVAEVKKMVIFAQKSGTLTIDPMTMAVVAQVRTQNQRRTGDPFFDNFFNDPFFNNSVQNVRKEIRSAPVTVKIKPLPDRNKPADFSGAVGSYSIKGTLDKSELKANEAVNLKISVSGTGNLELIDKLNVDLPKDFESYDPKVSTNITTSAGGANGSKSFEYLLIPRNPGTYTIKPVKLTFFDLGRKDYVTVSTPEFTIKVGKGDGNATIAYGAVDKEDVKYIGSDIRFIKTDTSELVPVGSFFFGSLWYWMLMILPLVLFTIIIIIWQKQVRLRSDVSFMKHKKATKVALKRLKKAGEYLKAGKEEPFYLEVSQALWGYLADKLSIPVAGLSMETISNALAQRQINESLAQVYKDLISNCEFARFAPGAKEEKMDDMYQQAIAAITKMERELK